MSDVKIDLDAVNPIVTDIAPKRAEEVEVVFVAFEDVEVRINQTTTRLSANKPTRVTRDQARILLEANKGYVRE